MTTAIDMAGDAPKPRWVYRFDNFDRAFVLLREALELLRDGAMSQLEKEGLIQRFEYSWELAWKLLADYLAYQGVDLPTRTPRSVVRTAFELGVIADGTEWMAALDARNKMSHTYDFKVFDQIIRDVDQRYFALLDRFHEDMMGRAVDRGD